MKAIDINTKLIDGYLKLLQNLSASDRLELIAKLSKSLKTDVADKKSTFKKSFGAFESDNDADQIINEIRSSRSFSIFNC